MKQTNLISLVLPAFGAALIAVLSQIVIPLGAVPFSLQTLAVGLCATLFKPREAVTSVGLYLLLGAVGLPVFAGGSSGMAALFGPTCGFLWGFLLYAIVTSFLTKADSSFIKVLAANCLGDALVFLCGLLSLHFLANMTWQAAFLAGVAPFLLADFGKVVLISAFCRPVYRSLKSSAYFQK